MSSITAYDVDLNASAGNGMSISDLLGHDLTEAQAMDADNDKTGLLTSAKATPKNDTMNVSAAVTPTPKKRGPKTTVDADGNVVASSAKKRAPKTPATDSDGNPIAPKKRTPKTPAFDDDGNLIPPKKRVRKASVDGKPVVKASGKATTQKSKEPVEDAADEYEGSNTDITKTKTTKATNAGKIVAVASEMVVESEDDPELDETEATIAQPSTPGATQLPQTPKKSTNRKAKQEIDGQMAPPSSTKPSSKKRVITAESDEAIETPSKKPRNVSTAGPAKANKIPTSLAEMSEVDKLVAKMKKENHKWSDIEKAVSDLTEQEVKKGSLAKRYARVMASITEWKDGDIERMLHVMNLVEKETADGIETFRRKAEQEKWTKAAELMLTVGGDKYTAAALEKCFKKEKSDGFPHRVNVEKVITGQSATAQEAGDDEEGDGEADGGEGASGNGDVDHDDEMLEV